MWPYWMMFLVPAVAAFLQPTRPWVLQVPSRPLRIGAAWALVAISWAVLIGLRDDVGGDWENYVGHIFEASGLPLTEILTRSEPGYWLVVWLFADYGGIYAANLIFAALFSIGLVVFCRAQPRPWLALAIAVPYLVIVLGMGYTRQGVALGMAMIGFVALQRKNPLAFVLWVMVGALFHRSAIVLLPLGAIATPRKKVFTIMWVGVATLALYQLMLRDSVSALQENYLAAGYESEGAWIRVLMNVVPAAILVGARKRFAWAPAERKLWITLAALSFAALAWLAVSPSSTAVDRLALYLIPVQLYVFTRLPEISSRSSGEKRVWVGLVLAYYATVQFVWLFFATHAAFWLPYRFLPLENVW